MPKTNLDDSVSLFPFLSILAAVIGILVLMITAVTLGQIGQDSPQADADAAEAARAADEARQRAEKFAELDKAVRNDVDEIRKLMARIANLKSSNQDAAVAAANLAAARQELAELQAARQSTQQTALQRKTELDAQAARLAKTTAEQRALEERLKPLAEQLAKLKQELANRGEPPKEAQVQIRPSGTGVALAPVFVECAAGSVVLHDRSPPLRIPTAQVAAHPEYVKLLDDVKARPRTTVVFLIRPDGVGTYRTAREAARSRSVVNGKLAIGSQGALDLSLFQQP